MNFIDKKLQQIAEQTQEQQKSKNSFIDQKLQQIAEQTRLQNQTKIKQDDISNLQQNDYKEKAQTLVKNKLDQTNEIWLFIFKLCILLCFMWFIYPPHLTFILKVQPHQSKAYQIVQPLFLKLSFHHKHLAP